MAHMPEKDPGLWAALIAWVIAHQPQLGAAGLSVAIAVFRVMYG
ncbi:phage holin family protein, partial [Pseudomonas guariconensis]